MQDTGPLLQVTDFPDLSRTTPEILQVNLGYICNLSCTHCHVNAGPNRIEQMNLATIHKLLTVLEQGLFQVLDLTGGAPEMNPHFRFLVEQASKLGVDIIDRCNLTILLEPGYEWLAPFLVKNKVIISASLPCYSEQNVAEQRGKGVFETSILALNYLNELGYGGDGLKLDLVYNPNGAILPPPQGRLEDTYKKRLMQNYGITFNNLLTITNMPISRFGAVLLAQNQFDDYMLLLKGNFSEDNLNTVMCRQLVSVDWQGNLYDCDFNQMLAMPMVASGKDMITSNRVMHLTDLLTDSLDSRSILTGDHCYGCTAGQGSSCSGALE